MWPRGWTALLWVLKSMYFIAKKNQLNNVSDIEEMIEHAKCELYFKSTHFEYFPSINPNF